MPEYDSIRPYERTILSDVMVAVVVFLLSLLMIIFTCIGGTIGRLRKRERWPPNPPRDVAASCAHPPAMKQYIPPASWLLGLPATKREDRGEKRVVRRRVCNALSMVLQSQGLGPWQIAHHRAPAECWKHLSLDVCILLFSALSADGCASNRDTGMLTTGGCLT